MANYDSKTGGSAGHIPFTINIPEEWLTDTSNVGCFWKHGSRFSYFFVRGFTGTTEQQCLNTRIPSGGAWFAVGWTTGSSTSTAIVPYSSTTSALSVNVRQEFKEDARQKVYGRIEVYWPGLKQSEIKYSRATTLCGHAILPSGNRTDREYFRNLPNVITVTIGGEHMSTRYSTYGGIMDMAKAIRPSLTANTTYYPGESYDNRQVIMDASSSTMSDSYATTSIDLVNVTRTGSSATSRLVTAAPAPNADTIMENKTIDEISPYNFTGLTCDEDTFSVGASETQCDYDCSWHSCEIDYGEYCLCETADDNFDCKVDQYPVKGCRLTQIPCLYASQEVFMESKLARPIPYSNVKIRMEGAFVSSNANIVLGCGFQIIITGETNSHPYVLVSPDYTFSGRVALNTITMGQDFDITVGNRYIYDNNAGQQIYSASQISDSTSITSIWFNISVFRFKRLRFYDGDTLVSDMAPHKMTCPVANTGATSWPEDDYGSIQYGLVDSMGGGVLSAIQPNRTVKPCIPPGCDEYSGPIDFIQGGTAIIVPIQNNKTCNNITMRFRGRFLNFNKTGQFNGLTGSTNDDTTGNRSITTYFSGTVSSQGWPYYYFNYYRRYSGSQYGNYLSGVTLNQDVDLTYGLGYINDNLRGGMRVYTASTQYLNYVPKYFIIDVGCLRIYRFTVYSGSDVAYDGIPYMFKDAYGTMVPALYDLVTDTVAGHTAFGYSNYDPCPEPLEDYYTFKLMNDGVVYYQRAYQIAETIDTTLFDNPTKECYTFTGWNPSIPATMPAEDFTATAQYTLNSHTITYYLKDAEHGSSSYVQYTSQTYNCGETIVTPTITPGSGYEFTGWSLSGHTTMPDQNINSYGEVRVYVPSYSISFYSGTTTWGSTNCNRLIRTDYYHAGDTISYPSVGMYCMSSTGWKTSCDGSTNAPATMPSNNLNVYLNYHYNMFTVYWRARKSDASTYTTYSTQEAEYGDTISPSSGPDLSGYAPSGYHWEGWPSGSRVVQCEDLYMDGVFYKDAAVYYTLTYLADGVVYDTAQYTQGQSVTAIAKPTDSTNCVTYSNWSGVPSTMPGNNVTATTTSSPVQYTITYQSGRTDGGSTTMIGTLYQDTYGCGATISPRSIPSQPGWEYSSWSPSLPGTMPNSSITVISTGQMIVYTATFKKADGTTYSTFNGTIGQTITRPAVYTKTGYDVSWPSSPATFGASNVTITAIETVHSWTITYKNSNGTVMYTDTYDYDAIISPRSAPQGFAWNPAVPTRMPDNNIVVTAVQQGYTVTISTSFLVTNSSNPPAPNIDTMALFTDNGFTPCYLGNSIYPGSSQYAQVMNSVIYGVTDITVYISLSYQPSTQAQIQVNGLGGWWDSGSYLEKTFHLTGDVNISSLTVSM